MESDALEAARSRYRAAYALYLDRTRLVANKLEQGLTPSVAEVRDEADATEQLAIARRGLLDALAAACASRP